MDQLLSGRDPSGQALVVPTEPCGLGAARFDPSRVAVCLTSLQQSSLVRLSREWQPLFETTLPNLAEPRKYRPALCELKPAPARRVRLTDFGTEVRNYLVSCPPVQAMSAGTAETAQQAQGEARQRGPQDASKTQSENPHG